MWQMLWTSDVQNVSWQRSSRTDRWRTMSGNCFCCWTLLTSRFELTCCLRDLGVFCFGCLLFCLILSVVWILRQLTAFTPSFPQVGRCFHNTRVRAVCVLPLCPLDTEDCTLTLIKWLDFKLLAFGGYEKRRWLVKAECLCEGRCSSLCFSFHLHSNRQPPLSLHRFGPLFVHTLHQHVYCFCAGGVISSRHSGPKELRPGAAAAAGGSGRRLRGRVCQDCPSGEEQGAAGKEKIIGPMTLKSCFT